MTTYRPAETTVWELARLADVADPDARDSSGAVWLNGVRDALAEAIEEQGDEFDADDLHQIADGAVEIYTHTRWRVFLDLAMYNEDPNEMGQPSDMTEAAGFIQYQVANRLMQALIEEWAADQ